MSKLKDVLAALDRELEWQRKFYKHLHQHPELSGQEKATAASSRTRSASARRPR